MKGRNKFPRVFISAQSPVHPSIEWRQVDKNLLKNKTDAYETDSLSVSWEEESSAKSTWISSTCLAAKEDIFAIRICQPSVFERETKESVADGEEDTVLWVSSPIDTLGCSWGTGTAIKVCLVIRPP